MGKRQFKDFYQTSGPYPISDAAYLFIFSKKRRENYVS